MYLGLSATPGSEETLPRKAPPRRVVHRRPFFRGEVVGLLCGEGVEPPQGRGRPSGARESQVLFWYIIHVTKMFSKIHLDITTTSTEDYCITRIHTAVLLHKQGSPSGP